MDILVVGLSLGRASLGELEALRSAVALDRVEGALLALEDVREVVRLTTCHRVEFALGVALRRTAVEPNPSTRLQSLLEKAVAELDRVLVSAAVPGSLPIDGAPPREGRARPSLDRVPSVETGTPELATNELSRESHERASSIYGFVGAQAFRHLLRVSLGMESPILGETEILGQLRAAYAASVEARTAGPITSGVFHRLFRAARRIRAHAQLDASAPSWSEHAAGAIVQGSRLRAGGSVRVIGSGSLARSISLSLRARGLVVIPAESGGPGHPLRPGHRDGVAESRRFDARSPKKSPIGRLGSAGLPGSPSDPSPSRETSSYPAKESWVGRGPSDTGRRRPDDPACGSEPGEPLVIITASGRGRLIGVEDLREAGIAASTGSKARAARTEPSGPRIDHRREATIHVWDFGMPRNVDPAAGTLPGVTLRTLEDLAARGSALSSQRGRSLAAAMNEVEIEVAEYERWRHERGLGSTLIRMGRLLELGVAGARAQDAHRESGPGIEPDGRSIDEGFRRRLLKAFTEIAGEAGDELEASTRLTLFERALERTAPRETSSRPKKPFLGSERSSQAKVGRSDPYVRIRPEWTSQPPATSEALKSSSSHSRAPLSSPRGRVSLVGAGPGHAGLLTLAAVDRLQQADVVYHDALVTADVLRFCREGARLVTVGKRRGSVTMPQSEIERAMMHDALDGLAVVRLKGGDPFVFGRGGEEALAMAEAGVPFEVIPGVTSGIAAPAAAGIPLTHRGLSGSAAFLTVHDLSQGPTGERAAERLRHLARGADTLVLFMGGAELARARAALIEAGLPPETPAALIENGTTASQRVVTGCVDTLDSLLDEHMSGPVLIVIGRTVALSEVLSRGFDVMTATPGPAPASVSHTTIRSLPRRPLRRKPAATDRRAG